ncbi:tRNA pseudouridine(38-40) synthase TruA [Alkalihalobacillus sp. 1P02AB]|uniref:tRNA pseudouridine(38-40) synthase TruA n=1 Tax=Alkalihalobacillus sp. 1P02AB TaxID=3132260 RepID=UPI0039A75EE5
MRKIACKVAYEGTYFAGYQVQPGKRTIQGEIEANLKKIHKGEELRIHSSGRTDSTVHATGQVFHFETSLEIPVSRWAKALNALLPNDIRIIEAVAVSEDFHARYSAISKQYRYRLLPTKEGDLFRRNHCYHFKETLDIEAIKEAAQHIVGRHDFSAFCAANTSVVDKIRTVTRLELQHVGDELLFIVEGDGFLYNMVRIMVGTLLEVGTGKRDPRELQAIIEGCDRTKAGKTAPGHGLYLHQVNYSEPIFS